MKINIKATKLDLTPSLETYIEAKFEPLSRFVKKFDEEGSAELRIEVGRTTRHHHKGDVFRAEANLRLPGKLLRAVHEGEDIRVALDIVRDTLRLEIEKYKTRLRPRPAKRR